MSRRNRLARLAERLRAELSAPAGLYLPFRVQGQTLGWVRSDRADALRAWPQYLEVTADAVATGPALADHRTLTAAFDAIARALSDAGMLTAWRSERYRVAAEFHAAPTFDLERAAARFFGIRTWSAHLNGTVASGTAARMWIARRSPGKAIDPGKLDNLVGGGIPTGASVHDTLVREAHEEAGIAPQLATRAKPAGVLHVRREQPDGLQVESIFVHDLPLPADFVPANQDAEAVEHRLCTIDEVLEVASDSDAMTFDASLVAVDWMVRHGYLSPDEPRYLAVVDGLRRP